MSFTNVYYKRTAATAKPCYVCYRPSTTVLATINTVDFLYTCSGHLTDAGFATRIPDEPAKAASTVSAEEIAKIKQEWEQAQDKKKEKQKEKEKEKEKDGKAEKDGEKDPEETKRSGDKPKSPTPSSTSSPASPPLAAKHERYALHRDFYAS